MRKKEKQMKQIQNVEYATALTLFGIGLQRRTKWGLLGLIPLSMALFMNKHH